MEQQLRLAAERRINQQGGDFLKRHRASIATNHSSLRRNELQVIFFLTKAIHEVVMIGKKLVFTEQEKQYCKYRNQN
jgi:hypothetical protein